MHQFAWPVILCSADSIFTWVCECVFLSVSSIIWLDDWLTDWAGALDHLQKPVTAHMYPMLHERAHFRITLLLVSSIFLVAFSCSVSDFTLINVWTPNLQQAKGYTYFMHKNIVNICIEISWNCFFFASFRDNCTYRCADIQFNVSHSTFPTCWSMLMSRFCFLHTLSLSSSLSLPVCVSNKAKFKPSPFITHINETITILLNVWFVGEIWMNGWGHDSFK